MILTAALACTLSFTLPAHRYPLTERCGVGTDSLTLACIRVYLEADCPPWPQPCGYCSPVLIECKDERGREGLRETLILTLPTSGLAFVIAFDTEGRPSPRCAWVRVGP